MSYLKSSLVRGERVIYQARHHWILTFRVIFWTIVWLVIPAVVFVIRGTLAEWIRGLFESEDGSAGVSETTIALVIAIAAGLVALLNIWGTISFFLWKWSSEYAVTTRRVMMKEGLIRRNTFEVQLGQLESARVDQGFIGRLLGYGALTLTATGGSSGRWPMLDNPLRFKRAIETTLDAEAEHRDRRRSGPAPAPAPAEDDAGPGTFRVAGVRKESQEDDEMVIEAKSSANAKVKAEMAGLVVTSVTRVDAGSA